VTTHLTIILGPGGVGKTTLAAGLALAHAHAGSRAGLLGVDPARRLRSALGLAELPEHGVAIPVAGTGALAVSLLDSGATLRRWIGEACPDERVRARVLADPFFRALADRLAELADAIGAARAAEWAERDPHLDELVLDTAPGTAALELLRRPEQLLAFAGGRMMHWLVRLARLGRGGRVMRQVANVTGGIALHGLGELLDALDATLATLTARLERARRWLVDPRTSIVLISGVRDDAQRATRALAGELAKLALAPSLVVLDRVLPETLAEWSPPAHGPPEARAFVRAVMNRVRAQQRIHTELVRDHGRAIDIPEAIGLDGPDRLAVLAGLAEPLREALR
jgi:anion-transporting  ArsA/GET3 family ATPase